MSFDARETGRFTGEPFELYRFRRGDLVWRYASGNRTRTLGDEVFTAPGGITRSAIQDSSQRAKNRLTISLPPDLPVAGNWIPYAAHGRVLVDVIARHSGEAEFTIQWTGRVVAPQLYDTKLELVCEPTRSTSKNQGQSLRWQRGCNLVLYAQGPGQCNADPELHKVEATIESTTILTIVSEAFAALPVGRLAGGFITWTRPDGEPEYRTIMAHLGDAIQVDYPVDAIMPVGTEALAFPGCAHTWDDCGYHENQDNFGGCLYIPVKSPHSGNPVQ